MCGQGTAIDISVQCGNEAFQYHRGLARTRYACYNRQPSFRNIDLKRFDRVNLESGQMNRAACKQRVLCGTGAQPRFGFAGKKRPDLRGRGFFYGGNCPLGNHMPALCTRLRPHFDNPVGFLQNLRVVVNQNHGIAVCN